MATRGPKPKPAHLRVVDGTHRTTRHGKLVDAEKVIQEGVAAFGKPVMPKTFKAGARAAWKRYIEPAGWLDAAREPAAIAFCELWQEFTFSPIGFPAAKHNQMRAYMSELGLTDERNRVGESGKQKDDGDDDFA